MNRSYQSLLLTVVLVIALPFVALAVQYDAPSVESYVQGHAKIVSSVHAGTSGAPAGFRMQWMRYSDYVANGYEWHAGPNEVQSEASFMGEPTLNTWDGELTTFCLEAEASAAVELGDLYDETGVSTSTAAVLELKSETLYVFRACANGDGAADDSEWSPTVTALTARNRNCTNSQGYWKNHESQWPVLELTIGGYTYNQGELLDILHEPARGNGLIIMAHQIIAVELNLAQGAESTDVGQALLDGHGLADGLVIPPVGSGRIHPRDASPLAQVMDDYNNGLIGPGYCRPVTVESSTWATVKALYR